MTTRKRPRKTITLDTKIIVYIDSYAASHGGLDFSRAVEAVIREHAAGLGATVLAEAVGSTDPVAHAHHLPSVVRTPTQWTSR